MDFRQYQEQALQMERALQSTDGTIVSILKSVSEIASLSGEHRKLSQDKPAYRVLPDRIAEELGEILWHIAAFANKFDLDLSTIARQNLERYRDRWLCREGQVSTLLTHSFDSSLPEQERLPRKFEVEIIETDYNGSTRIQAFVNGKQMGDDLTDNSYDNDGYRFHDVFHLSYAAVLGWSPVVRKMLGCKRKSHPKIDEVEDGGRAIATEESISLLVFQYAQEHQFLEGILELDHELLKTVKKLTSGLEVSQRSLSDWKQAIFAGCKVWRQVNQNGGGVVVVDLDGRSIDYRPHNAASHS
jgi:hypothetical protein